MGTPIQLTNGQLRALTYVEQCFWEHGSIPTNEKISDVIGIAISTIQDYWKVDNFRKALGIRGVDFNPERSNSVLTATQLALANMLMNTTDQRSTREKLKEINVSTQQYNAWLRQAAFRDHLAKRGEELFKSSDHVAYKSLTSAVGAGDVTALKLFFEMRGIYNPKVDVNVNVEMVLVKVIEIIARHVTDPVALTAIADDLDNLNSGGINSSGISSGAVSNIGSSGGLGLGLPVGTLAGVGEAIYIGPDGAGFDPEADAPPPVPGTGYVPNYEDIEVTKTKKQLDLEKQQEEELDLQDGTSTQPEKEKKSFEEGGSLLNF